MSVFSAPARQKAIHLQETNSKAPRAWRDLLGVIASIGCAIHCAAMPFVVGLLPLIGLSFLADPSFHKWMVGICLALALLAFVPGWRQHRRLTPAIIGICGLSLISFAAFAGPDDCCPTPCEATPSATESTIQTAGMQTAGLVSEPTCEASCCPSEGSTAGTPAEPTQTAAVSENNETCTASCCPTETEDVVLAAGAAGYIELMWLVMTPLGGLFLVGGHLTNHRFRCRCIAGCCSTDCKN